MLAIDRRLLLGLLVLVDDRDELPGADDVLGVGCVVGARGRCREPEHEAQADDDRSHGTSPWQKSRQMLANFGSGTLVPRTRSSHHIAAGTVANFGFKSGTRLIAFLVSFPIPRSAQRSRQMLADFGIGTLVPMMGAGGDRGQAHTGPGPPKRRHCRADLR